MRFSDIHIVEILCSVDDCIENFGELRYFLFSGGTTSYVPLRSLFNLNKIGLISLTSLSISWETAISEFYENETFVGYNENSIERVYFQLNDLCGDYSNKYNFSELIEMIDEYDACTKSCNTDAGELWCPSSKKLAIYSRMCLLFSLFVLVVFFCI